MKVSFASLSEHAARGTVVAMLLFVLSALSESRAQGAGQGVPNAMQGFSQNRDQPIEITAAVLEIRDKKKQATLFRQCESGAG